MQQLDLVDHLVKMYLAVQRYLRVLAGLQAKKYLMGQH